MERTYIDTLAQLIARSPTCYHAAATAAALLAADGYAPLDEGRRWQLRPGGKYYMTRGGSALIAFRVPEHAPAGFRLAAAHGDSPCFKLKEHAALRDGGYLRLNTEVYGGLRMSSWFDRPLSVAGRLFTEEDGVLRQTLVNIDRDLLVIPSVAIHFDRAANDGVKYRANVDTLPLAGSDGAADILTLAAESAGLRPEDVLGSDLLAAGHAAGQQRRAVHGAPSGRSGLRVGLPARVSGERRRRAPAGVLPAGQRGGRLRHAGGRRLHPAAGRAAAHRRCAGRG